MNTKSNDGNSWTRGWKRLHSAARSNSVTRVLMDGVLARSRVDGGLVNLFMLPLASDSGPTLAGDCALVGSVVVESWLVEGLERTVGATKDWREELSDDCVSCGGEFRSKLTRNGVGEDGESCTAQVSWSSWQVGLNGYEAVAFVSSQWLQVEEQDVCSIC